MLSTMLAMFCCQRRLDNGKKCRKSTQSTTTCSRDSKKCANSGGVVALSNASNRSVGHDRRNDCRARSSETKKQDRRYFRVYLATNKELTNRLRAGPKELQDYIWRLCREKQLLNEVNVATIFHASAKHPYILTPDVLNYLMDAAEDLDMDARALGNTLYGLQGLKNSAAVHRVVRIMAAKVQSSTEDFTPQQIGNALYGMQNLRDAPEVRVLLCAMETKLRMCKEHMSVQGIASACFGMKSLSDSPEVRSVIQALAVKVEQLNDMRETRQRLAEMPSLHRALHPHMSNQHFALDGWGVSNALYGLQNLVDTPQVRRLIGAIAVQLENLAEPMKAQEVTQAFYGLRSFHGSPTEIRRLLEALAVQLDACTEMFLPRHIAVSLYGLRWLGQSDEGRRVLAGLAERTRQCKQDFDGQAVGNALYGLLCYGNCKEMHSMLEALRPKVEECRGILTEQEVGNAFYGLRTIEDCTEVRRMLLALTPRLEQCQKMDPQAISNTLFGVHSLGNVPQTSIIMSVLVRQIQQCKAVFSGQAVANSFSGLQAFQDVTIARKVIAALAPKLANSRDVKPDHLGNILINFRTVGDSKEARVVLKILEQQVDECKDHFHSQHVLAALVGLSHLGGSAEAMGVLRALVPHVQRSKNFGAREIATCLSSIRIFPDSAVVRAFLKAFAPKIDQCSESSLTEAHLKKALQSLQLFEDSEEMSIVLHSLAKLALRSSVPLDGTSLESISIDPISKMPSDHSGQ